MEFRPFYGWQTPPEQDVTVAAGTTLVAAEYILKPSQEFLVVGSVRDNLIGISGVTISGFPDGPVVTDRYGNFKSLVPDGWEGTLTASKVGVSLVPAGGIPLRIDGKISRGQNFYRAGTSPVPDRTRPVVKLLAPVDGETLRFGDTYTVRWSAEDESGLLADVKLQYRNVTTSETWKTIAEGLQDVNEFVWTVPDQRTSRTQIRVVAEDLAGNVGARLSPRFTVTGGGTCRSPDRAPYLRDWVSTPHSYYTIDWFDVANTDHYVLQEDTHPGFPDPVEYITVESFQAVSDKARNRYYYRVKAEGTCGSTDWSETKDYDVLANQPPLTPFSPAPAHNAAGNSRDLPEVAWDGGDPDLDNVEFDVYLGRSEPLSKICGKTTSQSCPLPEALLAGSAYFWKVVAIDEYGARTAGPVWTFTTEDVFPDLAVTGFNVDNVTPEFEGAISATATVANLGNEAADDTLIHYYLESFDGTESYLLQSVRTSMLEIDASQVVTTELTMPRGFLGPYQLVARLNKRNNPREQNRDNNDSSLNLTIVDSQAPTVQIWRPTLADNIPYLTGFKMKIRWSEEDNEGIGQHDIHYSEDGGAWLPVVTGTFINGQGYDWLIPDHLAEANVRVRVTVRDHSGSSSAAISEEVPISSGGAPMVSVLSPVGGEQLLSETPFELRWDASSPEGIETIELDLYRDGLREETINQDAPNTGSYLWSPPSYLINRDWVLGVLARGLNGVDTLELAPASFRILDSFEIPPPWNTPLDVFTLPDPPPVPPNADDYGNPPKWDQVILGPKIAIDPFGDIHCLVVYRETIRMRDPGAAWTYQIGNEGILYRKFSGGSLGPQTQSVFISYDESTNYAEHVEWERSTAWASDAEGRLHLAFIVSAETPHFDGSSPDSLGQELFYSNYDGLAWSPPVNVSETVNSTTTTPSLAITSTGGLHFVWRERISDRHQVYYRSYDTTSGWSQAQMLVDYAYVPYVLSDSLDNLLVVAQRYNTANEIAILRNDGSGWSDPETLWPGSFGNHIPKLSLGPSGDPYGYIVNGPEILVSRLTTGDRQDWAYAFPDAEPWTETTLFFDRLGFPHLGYMNITTVARRVFVERRLYDDGSFGPIRFIDSTAGEANDISATFTSSGTAYAIWHETLTGDFEPVLLNYAHFTDDLQAPIVTVSQPSGGDTILGGSAIDILWSASDDVGVASVDLKYSVDGAVTYQTIALSLPNTGSYTWSLPAAELAEVVVSVAARDANGNLGVGLSQSFHVELPIDGVAVTAPNGGEKLVPGDIARITWEGGQDATFWVGYSLDDGELWAEIARDLVGVSDYDWVVPFANSGRGRVRVVADFGNGEVRMDESDAAFTVQEEAAPFEPHTPYPPVGAGYVPPGVSLTWGGGHPDGEAAVTYQVLFGAALGSLTPLCTTSSFICLAPGDLSSNTQYSWQVVADDGSITVPGPVWYFHTGDPSGLVPPGNLAAVQQADGSVHLAWSDENAGDVQHIVEKQWPGMDTFQQVAQLDGAALVFEDPDVEGNHDYVYRVRAMLMDEAGPVNSEASNEEHIAIANQAPEPPNTPTPLAGSQVLTLQPTFGWAGGDPDALDTVTWRLSLWSEGVPRANHEPLAQPNWIQEDALLANTLYVWQVLARDDRGGETLGSIWTLETPATVPDPPTGLHASQSGDRVYLGWKVEVKTGESLFLERRLASDLPFELIDQWQTEELTLLPQLAAVDLDASSLVADVTSDAVTWRVGIFNEEGYYSYSEPVSVVVTPTQLEPCYSLNLSSSGSGTTPGAAPGKSPQCPAGQYHAGQLIELTADPANDWVVESWFGTDDDASTALMNSLTMPAAEHLVSVTYSPVPLTCYSLTLTKIGEGEVPTAQPIGSAGCPAGSYNAGEFIDLAASPAPGWRVHGWAGTGNDASTALTNRVTHPAAPHNASVYYAEGQVAQLLLVDDDDNNPDVVATYEAALGSVQGSPLITVWDTGNSDVEPDAAFLAPFAAVIWFSGAEYGGFAGPSAASEGALASYLDAGGCLLLTSQDYIWDRGGQGADIPTPFMTSYLGLDSATSDQVQVTVTGAGRLFQGLGPYDLDPPFSNHSDFVTPSPSAQVAWQGVDGPVALSKDTSTYTTTFWTIPLEALPTHQDRVEALQRFLDGCGVNVIFQDDFESGDLGRWSGVW